MPGRGRCRPEVALTPLAWNGMAGAGAEEDGPGAGAGNRQLGNLILENTQPARSRGVLYLHANNLPV